MASNSRLVNFINNRRQLLAARASIDFSVIQNMPIPLAIEFCAELTNIAREYGEEPRPLWVDIVKKPLLYFEAALGD